jgi:hypothetical protein
VPPSISARPRRRYCHNTPLQNKLYSNVLHYRSIQEPPDSSDEEGEHLGRGARERTAGEPSIAPGLTIAPPRPGLGCCCCCPRSAVADARWLVMGGAGMAGVAAAAVCYDEDAVTERQWSRAVDNAQDLDQLRSVRTIRSLPHVPRCLPACLPPPAATAPRRCVCGAHRAAEPDHRRG